MSGIVPVRRNYQLKNPVENLNKEEQGQRFSSHRWTTGLALDRARRLEELLLETEPEWRLFEALKAMGIFFSSIQVQLN